ncbi:MAG TPA: TIGR02996 domain-containing protein, partial [Pirellulales bacterium]
MDEETAFLAEIRRRYWDDAPRLIYADWLEEQGEEPRAEFIRVQCELERMAWFDPARPELALRERTLQNEHSREWAAPALELGAQRVTFSRGLIEGVEISGGAMLTAGVELFRRCRTVRMATVSLHNVTLARFLQSGLVAFLTELTLANNRLPDRALEQLAESRDLGRLISLNLAYNEFETRGVRALAESGTLGNLRLLNMTGNRLGGRAIDLLPGPRLKRLSRLNLSENRLDAAGLWSLFQRLPQSGVRSLNVSDNHIHTLHDHVRFPIGLARLESLALGGNPVGDAMAGSLAESRHVAGLVRLDLQRSGVSPV